MGNVEVSSWERWNPEHYLGEYYTGVVVPDEVEAIKFHIEVLRNIVGQPIVLEFGCGPTVHRALAAAPYVSKIHMADYLQRNLVEVRRWIDGNVGSHNWSHYARFILQCEGIVEPTEQQIAERMSMTRSRITQLSRADASERFPLGRSYKGYYPHVYSGFCADSATNDKKTWARYMRNIASHVAPGGSLMIGALRKCKFYRSGNYYFPSADIDEDDLRKVLKLDFLAESINIEVREFPQLKEEGYTSILLAHALKGK